ncbi:hypothetical protein [Paenibacillus shenyangensis]|uniref:hypothetical protein n=1 Tax=Paenibacillus sp. A9 TaxID=1284352 RepID=UPI000378FBF4|nr:hypothetical protein [Paenibacillus sp. A9]
MDIAKASAVIIAEVNADEAKIKFNPTFVRDEVADFAIGMEEVLVKNDHKSGWKECDLAYLMDRLFQEMQEVYAAIGQGESAARIRSECLDVANFAMMIADNVAVAEKEADSRGNISTSSE